MQLVETVIRKHRDKTVLALLIAASIALLALPRSARLDVASRALGAIYLPIEKWTAFAEKVVAMRDENLRLKRMVATLMLEREHLLQYRDERERLRRLADFKEGQSYQLVPAEVVGRSLDRLQTVLVIDKGGDDGLAERMPVFSYQGLVGRLDRVFPGTSWVRVIASRNSAVSCVDRRSRVVGVLEWRQRNLFELTGVNSVEDVQAGDTLVTSGFGGVVPKGFPVAIVTRAGPDDDGLSLRVDARSPVKFTSLEEVFVMTERVPWDRSIFYEEADTLLMREILEVAP
jgi:rod shape-determining protein MreC